LGVSGRCSWEWGNPRDGVFLLMFLKPWPQ
jgi:hypothetical protein